MESVPNKFASPSEASRKDTVSTPCSVMGTLANDWVVIPEHSCCEQKGASRLLGRSRNMAVQTYYGVRRRSVDMLAVNSAPSTLSASCTSAASRPQIATQWMWRNVMF